MSSKARWIKGMGLWLSVAMPLLMVTSAFAELQQVSVGGELRIRGRQYFNTFSPRGERIDPQYTGWRPLGPKGTTSVFKWDGRGTDWTRYETSVLLNVKADFTDNVTAFIELYDWHIWGEDFRSNYLTGEDRRADSSDDVEIEQAYVEMRQIFGAPLKLRVGRQAIKLGKGWLVDDMLTPSQYSSHDAIRLTWTPADDLSIDAIMSKLNEQQIGDEDTDFYALYGTWTGIPELTVSAYWFFLRSAQHVETTKLGAPGEWAESLFGWDSYDPTRLHTVGTYLFGKSNGFDYSLELAYQFGDASHVGSYFKPVTGAYGDPGANYDNWGLEAILGYTFSDVKWQPRPYVMASWYDGKDNRDITFWEWLNPFYRPEASISFNRLFSSTNSFPTINDNGWLSNVIQVQLGLELQVTEKVRTHVHVAKDWVDDPFDPPVSFEIGDRRFYSPFSFWTEKGSRDLGWEAAAWVKYQYSADLWFLLYGNYLWTGEGLAKGAFIQYNGTEFSGGTDDNDAGYLFWMAVLKF